MPTSDLSVQCVPNLDITTTLSTFVLLFQGAGCAAARCVTHILGCWAYGIVRKPVFSRITCLSRGSHEGGRITSPDSDFFRGVDLSDVEAEQPDVMDQASGSAPSTLDRTH
jgi:hypothetical protein